MDFQYTKRVITTVVLLGWCAFAGGLAADTYVVTHAGDSGAGSLRQAVVGANSREGADTVAFSIVQEDPGFNGEVWTVRSAGAYEMLDDSTFIDGSSQTRFAGDTNPEGPEIELSSLGTVFDIRSSHNTLEHLVINGFEATAVRIHGGRFNRLSGNYIGTDSRGGAAECDGIGIHLSRGSQKNEIFSNVIAGTVPAGVYLEGDGVFDNVVRGNRIGTNRDGSNIIEGGNGGHGIFVLSNLTTFEGPERNRICANTIAGFQWGIYFAGAGTEYNVIEENYVGTNEHGLVLGNRDAGIHLCDGPKHNRVSGNIVAGVTGGQAFHSGINLNGSETWDNIIEENTVTSNYYGLSLSGWTGGRHTADCVNDDCVNVLSGNTIRNNVGHGIHIAAQNADNRISGNAIVDNGGDGVHISGANNGILLSQNSVSRNFGLGILSSRPAPQLETYENFILGGTAAPAATVEFFSDTGDEGERFLGETRADAGGCFSFDLAHTAAYGFVTATSTAEGAGTSGFSSPHPVPLSIVSSSLREGWMGVAYSETLSAIGGFPPYVWSLVSGSLPSGFHFTSHGIIEGTPEEADTTEFGVEVSDGADSRDFRTLVLTVHLCSKGDVNNDGGIDITDVLRVVHMILRVGDPPSDRDVCAADCNTDGRIDVLDVVGIVNMILGAGPHHQ